ncbi:MAG: ferritin family protein [Candidatus Aminicenantes bacterium]|nr:MAG: ferritin family protein [Candidatus Aminicenantes bacterium]
MNLDPKLQPYEILAGAVRSEVDAAGFYSKLHEKVKNELLREKLKFLIFEEEKHRKTLERLFSQRFPERVLKIPEIPLLPPIKASLGEKASVSDLFQAALQAEKISEDFYKQASEKMKDETSQKILKYLSRVERSHYFMIKSEIDLLEKFPDYYDVEDFHFGQEMVHVGP